MRWFQALLSVTLLVTGALAVKKTDSTEERFNTFHSKSLSSTPLRLTDVTYKSITAAPRDYSVTILLTALDPRYGCDMCQGFQSEWETLAKSWTKGDKKAESRMLFGTLDFTDGRDTFLSVGHLRNEASPFRARLVEKPLKSTLLIAWARQSSLGCKPPLSSFTSGPPLAPTLWPPGNLFDTTLPVGMASPAQSMLWSSPALT